MAIRKPAEVGQKSAAMAELLAGVGMDTTFKSGSIVEGTVSAVKDDDVFTDIGYKISLFLTVAMSVVLLAAGIYTVAVFFSANPVAGWTTTMLVMSFGFFGLFVILAFVLKYLSVILNLVFVQKQYIVESVQKITK